MLLTDPHSQPADTCLSALRADPAGLCATETARRLAEHGPNRLPVVDAHGWD
jgi:hypothetical protein